jgi:hypothetical protein
MIRKTLIAAAALAALTTGFAGNAEAKIATNGISVNGVSLNGITMNGITLNGLWLNGLSLNGVSAQSAAPLIEGVILPSGVILLAR